MVKHNQKKIFGRKSVFLQALLLTIFVFGIGILLGIGFENMRNSIIVDSYIRSEILLMDTFAQSDIVNYFEGGCSVLIDSHFDFVDRIYQEAKTLEQYDWSNRFTERLKITHRRYDLLRTIAWMNTVKIRKKCNPNYYDIIYLYEYNTKQLDIRAKNKIFSLALGELKEKYGNKILLIPIAVDNDVQSLDFLVSEYNLTKFPSVLINQEIKLNKLEDIENIEEYIENK